MSIKNFTAFRVMMASRSLTDFFNIMYNNVVRKPAFGGVKDKFYEFERYKVDVFVRTQK